MTTSIQAPAVGLVAVLVVAACAGGSGAPETAQPPTQQPGEASSRQPGQPSSRDSPPVSGTWTGTMTRHFSQTTTTTSESDSTLLVVTYDATVQISSTLADINGWTLTGPATIKATQSSDYKAHFTSTLGDCDKHYTDEDLAEGGSVATGGLAIADDATYEFNLNIPGFDGGTEVSMRDETGCLGSTNTETNPWPVGPVNLDGSGDVTDPLFLSGSKTTPTEGGADTIAWSLTLSR